MTDESHTEAVDELVSDLYRELPAPPTPDQLNRSILLMAAGPSRGSDRFLSASWLKPVAWAATIALGLAIVLELSELETSELPKPLPGEDRASAPAEKVLLEVAVEHKGRKGSFAASAPVTARPVAQKPATDQSAAGRQQPGKRVVVLSSVADKRALDRTAACDEEARKSAEDWLTCIKNLRAAGANELADREYTAFLIENPNNSEGSGSNK